MKKPQCKDIPTRPILEFLMIHKGQWCNNFGTEYDRSVQRAMPENIPEKLVLAKMKNLIAKGYVDGCDCGCRGDYEILPEGELYLKDSAV